VSGKRWRFHAAAYEEMLEAARWYEKEAALGEPYLAAVERAVRQLQERPVGLLVPGLDPKLRVRRVFVQTFPYAVVFVDAGDEFIIVAVMHLRRRPGYWKKRVRSRTKRPLR